MKVLVEDLTFEGLGLFRSRGGLFTGENFHPEHRHDAVEILLPDRLAGEALTPLERIPFKNRYAIVIPANLLHATWKREAKPGGGFYFFQFDAPRLIKMFDSFGLSPPDDSALRWLFHGNLMMEVNLDLIRVETKALLDFRPGQRDRQVEVLFSAFSLIQEILRMRRFHEKTPTRGPLGLRSDWTDSIIRHLEGHYGEAIKLSDLASTFDCTAAHLCRQFKSRTGSTPGEYLRYIRLTRAMTLLFSGEVKVGDVAATVGFDDRNHFTRCFKALTGETPKVFQMRYQKRPGPKPSAAADSPITKLKS